MMFMPIKGYQMWKTLKKQTKKKWRMRSGREYSRTRRNQSHNIWKSNQMLIQEVIWESTILVAGMVMKKGSFLLPVHREYVSTKTMVLVKTTRHRRTQLLDYRII